MKRRGHRIEPDDPRWVIIALVRHHLILTIYCALVVTAILVLVYLERS